MADIAFPGQALADGDVLTGSPWPGNWVSRVNPVIPGEFNWINEGVNDSNHLLTVVTNIQMDGIAGGPYLTSSLTDAQFLELANSVLAEPGDALRYDDGQGNTETRIDVRSNGTVNVVDVVRPNRPEYAGATLPDASKFIAGDAATGAGEIIWHDSADGIKYLFRNGSDALNTERAFSRIGPWGGGSVTGSGNSDITLSPFDAALAAKSTVPGLLEADTTAVVAGEFTRRRVINIDPASTGSPALKEPVSNYYQVLSFSDGTTPALQWTEVV